MLRNIQKVENIINNNTIENFNSTSKSNNYF